MLNEIVKIKEDGRIGSIEKIYPKYALANEIIYKIRFDKSLSGQFTRDQFDFLEKIVENRKDG